jgi:hypothetical protein
MVCIDSIKSNLISGQHYTNHRLQSIGILNLLDRVDFDSIPEDIIRNRLTPIKLYSTMIAEVMTFNNSEEILNCFFETYTRSIENLNFLLNYETIISQL